MRNLKDTNPRCARVEQGILMCSSWILIRSIPPLVNDIYKILALYHGWLLAYLSLASRVESLRFLGGGVTGTFEIGPLALRRLLCEIFPSSWTGKRKH
jgi:hypothetical protein